MERIREEQQAVLHINGPQTEIEYRIAWAKTYLKKSGALENSTRGIWSVTPKGRELTQGDMPAVVAHGRATTRWSRDRPSPAAGQAVEPDDGDDLVELVDDGDGAELDTGERLDDWDWKQQMLEVILGLPPDSFEERLSRRLLTEVGFVNVNVTGRSGDGGIDGVGVYRVDRVALISFPVFFQCKRHRGSVSPSAVRDFRGALAGRGDKGLFFTTGTFTAEAKKEAARDGVPPIELIDGERLCDLLKEYGLGVTTELIQKVTVHPRFFADV